MDKKLFLFFCGPTPFWALTGVLRIIHPHATTAKNDVRHDPQGHGGEMPAQPLFEGFAKAGLSGSDLADLAGVSAPTVSKWRRGLIQIPPSRIAFLTLALAHLLEDLRQLRILDATLNKNASPWGKQAEIIEEVSGGLLKVQEQINMELDPREIRIGAQMFREWWSSGAWLNLQKAWLRAIGARHPNERIDNQAI
ncbi:MAG: helix-turn-helix domain-containing protein [Rhodospirillaceae bacterium]|nr:helix-turn-helix domain-containing protein [Rhodospirillaceae bacterium]